MSQEKKYIIHKTEILVFACRTLYRIQALKDFSNIKAGDKGGWIEKEENLSQEGDCWIHDEAKVFDNAEVSGNAQVFGKAQIYEYACVNNKAKIYGNTRVYGNTEISGNAIIEKDSDYEVFKNNWSSGRYFTYTKSNKMWSVGCFYGTGEELIKKAYKDSQLSGKMYELYVNLVKQKEELSKS